MSSKHLTLDVAKRFLTHNESVDLAQFQTADEEAAALLASHDDDLSLGGLEELPEGAAMFLVRRGCRS